ncbi:hypothetical protein AN478_04000 [Thiohalorhabdus denitrificans]|uniref:Uncharacterized protein n=1 Tax=Thiohalorhabdus denitrificans TaxID=381306 RepID=A0A0N8PNB8_9GAMM|nr:hypothetical protein [Thiohalorhabdus denitrificans]KPV41085.1 hypothetical protein AN478_04000 [Thiohalorhabdus denitrificans]SCY39099.1 hypothetical protein SAMN05661077_1978 [Thiohalorhabdus denitrificans]
MAQRFGGTAILAGGLLAGALLTPGLALGHGEKGEHVEEFQDHLDDYGADVRKLGRHLDTLAERYAQGEDVAAEVDGFVEKWEAVQYHAAVEEVATPLYPPIWQAISGLRQAVEEGEDPGVVRERADRLTAALHEGLGGLKLKAGMEGDGASRAAEGDKAAGPEASFARIREGLDHAVEEYADGHSEDAKKHIHDAYFNEFEGLEGGLIEQDPDLVARLEEDFNGELPGLIDQGAPVEEVRAKVDEMKDALGRSEELLKEADKDQNEVF